MFAEPYENELIIGCDGSLYYDLSYTWMDEGFLSLRRIDSGDTNRFLLPTSVMNLDQESYPKWQQMTGEAKWVLTRGHWHLGLVPKKQSGVVYAKCALMPVKMFSDDDVPVFGRQHHIALADYGAYDLFTKDKNYEVAMGYWNDYVIHRLDLRSNKAGGSNDTPANIGVLGAYQTS